MVESLKFNLGLAAAKNIVHVLDSLEVGGLERTVVRLAIAQKKTGNNVQVITIWRNGPLAAALTDAGIKITCMNKRAGLDIQVIKNIRRIVAQNIEVIHSHNTLPHYYATAASIGIKVRRISTRHDMGVHLKSKRMQFLYRLSLYKTHAVVAVCEAAKSRFVTEKIIPEKLISVVYNGIPEVNSFSEQNRTTFKRQQLKLPMIGPIVGSIGRLNVVKDYGTLISAFKEVLTTFPTANLVIAGDGPERRKLLDLIEKLNITERVFLLGERNDVSELLEQFDLFLLTSLTEGFSVALVEAAWSGLPIIATDVGGNCEIVQNGITGYLTQPQNTHEIKTKIETLLGNENLRAQFGLVARKHAEANWTLELMLERYQRVYQEQKPGQTNGKQK